MPARPAPSEYAPFYAGYVEQVPDGPILAVLEQQIEETLRLLGPLSDAQALHRYAPGKWSIKEVVGHLIDAERVFAYRALRFARGDATALPGFDQDPYVARAGFDEQPLDALRAALRHVRLGTLDLARSFDEQTLLRRGTASGSPISVRALLYCIAGHERHHAAVLRDRYLPVAP